MLSAFHRNLRPLIMSPSVITLFLQFTSPFFSLSLLHPHTRALIFASTLSTFFLSLLKLFKILAIEELALTLWVGCQIPSNPDPNTESKNYCFESDMLLLLQHLIDFNI